MVTRPREQAGALAERIEQAGGRPFVYPAIEIEPLDPPELKKLVDNLGKADLAIFVSPTAVRMAMRLVRALGGWPPGMQVAATGSGTRAELERQGVCGALAPASGADSEALLALPQLNQVAGRGVLIFRGEGGRELLAKALAARGARVFLAECYRRIRPRTDPSPLLAAWQRSEIDAVTAFSAEALDNLFALLGAAGAQWLRETPLFVPHARIAEGAAGLGIREALVGGPGDEQLLARLVAYFANGK